MFGWIKNKSKEKAADATTVLKKTINLEEAKTNFKDIREMSSAFLKPKKIENAKSRQSFTETVVAKGLSTADLDQIYVNYAISFYVSAFFALLCFCSGIYYAFFMLEFMPFVVSFSIFFVCLANMFRFSFNTFKIKSQKFCSVEDWWNNPVFWFPKFKR